MMLFSLYSWEGWFTLLMSEIPVMTGWEHEDTAKPLPGKTLGLAQ